MYEGPSAQSEQTTEEYLLGKIFKPKDNGINEIKEMGKLNYNNNNNINNNNLLFFYL